MRCAVCGSTAVVTVLVGEPAWGFNGACGLHTSSLEGKPVAIEVGCTCTPTIAGISDGPSVDCAVHGIGNVGGCVYCWGSGIIDDYEGDRPCSGCNGTGTPAELGASS